MTKDEALKLAREALEEINKLSVGENAICLPAEIDTAMDAIKAALAQPERYITDAMKVRQAVAQALLDDVYAEELEQPEAKQSGTIFITMPTPIAYLCENATGYKYFRWKKPSSTYKPIPLYTTPPQRTWVGLTHSDIDQGLLRSDYALKTAEAWRAGVVFAMTKLKEKNT